MRDTFILLLDGYDNFLAPEVKFDKEWFISDLDRILLIDNDRARQDQLTLWIAFLNGCKTGRYL
jgi:hypothetical protein